MNIFQSNDGDTRLKLWFDFREEIKGLNMRDKCIAVDNWWQAAPLINHHLHPADIENWPNPWELLTENSYCTIARGLGMCYTLAFTGVKNVNMVEAKNRVGEEVVLVLVDNSKYILNYWPNTVISNTLDEFEVTKKIKIENILTKYNN